jgi:hypothetical protein
MEAQIIAGKFIKFHRLQKFAWRVQKVAKTLRFIVWARCAQVRTAAKRLSHPCAFPLLNALLIRRGHLALRG